MMSAYRFMDGHMHLTNWVDPQGINYFDRFDELQRNAGLDGFCINGLTDGIYGSVDSNVMAAIYKLHNPTAYAYAGIVYPTAPVRAPFPEGMDTATQYREMREVGFDGIKILYKPDVQKRLVLPIDDGVFAPLFALAEQDRIPFVWHVADPEYFWRMKPEHRWSYSDGTFPTLEELYGATMRVLERYPKLCVTFAHFFFWSAHPNRLRDLFARFENVGVDVTPGAEMFADFTARREEYRVFFEDYADRIFFGTDSDPTRKRNGEELCSWVRRMIETEEWAHINGMDMQGLKLSPAACERILGGNFLQRNGGSPKPIDEDALRRYAEKYAPLMTHEANKAYVLAWLRGEVEV